MKEILEKNNSSPIQEAPFLTYFEDKYGLIYYSSGSLTHPNPNLVRSVLAYIPADENIATRRQLVTNKLYIKDVDNGGLKKVENGGIVEATKDIIYSRYTQDPLTGEPILAVPVDEVIKVYNPREAFKDLVEGRALVPSDDFNTALQKARTIFTEYGIQEKNIGVYGGLQVMLLHTSGREVRDIDMVIFGLDNLPLIKKIASDYRLPADNLSKSNSGLHPYNRANIRRDYYSRFEIGEFPIEMKLVRDLEDTNNYPDNWVWSGVVDLDEGIVLDDSEVLTIPASFLIRTVEGKEKRVSTAMFNYLGAGWIGDRVRFRGKVGIDGHILITDPNDHYIDPLHG